MELSSPAALSGHHIDFIELDGSIGLSLDFDDALSTTTDSGGHALVWGVREKPWDDGDLLMIRMSQSPIDLSDTTNDTACDGYPVSTAIPTILPPPDIRTARFYPTSGSNVGGLIVLGGSGTCDNLWNCVGESESDDSDDTYLLLINGGSVNLGFDVGGEEISGAITDAWFEVRLSANAGAVAAGQYGYKVYSGSELLSESLGQLELGSEWLDETVLGFETVESLSEVSLRIDGPSSAAQMKVSGVRMAVEYDAARTGR